MESTSNIMREIDNVLEVLRRGKWTKELELFSQRFNEYFESPHSAADYPAAMIAFRDELKTLKGLETYAD